MPPTPPLPTVSPATIKAVPPLRRAKLMPITSAGFTLLEVLVALVIVGTALAASLRAISSLTQNSTDLRLAMMATWSAENRLTQIRLAREWPPLGQRSFACAQGEWALRCEEEILATPNPAFRRVQVTVLDDTGRHILMLSQVVPNAI